MEDWLQVPLMLSHGKSMQFTLIGLGDIVLPGLLICFCLRLDDAKGINKRSVVFLFHSPAHSEFL